MNIGVLSFSGNVGKTILTDFVLAPRLRNTKVIRVESSVRNDAKSLMQLEGREAVKIQHELILNSCLERNDLVIDISCFEIKSFMQHMKSFEGSMDDFDLLVIPVTPEKKQQRDTIRMIDRLFEDGVKKQTLKVVFNRVQPQMILSETFHTLIEYLSLADINVSINSYIPQTDLFEQVNESSDTCIESILAGSKNYSSSIYNIDRAFALKHRLDEVANEILSDHLR